MSALTWDKCFSWALTSSAAAVGAFIGSWKIQQGSPAPISWQSAALLGVSIIFGVAALVLYGLTVILHPAYRSRQTRRKKRWAVAQAEQVARELRGASYDARRSWERFYRIASEFLSTYETAAKPQGWRERLRAQWEDSVRAAYLLARDHQESEKAVRLVVAFKTLVDGSDPDGDFGIDAAVLKDFLFAGYMFYRSIEKDARIVARSGKSAC